MIAKCDHCGKEKKKVYFCSTRCRVANHRGSSTIPEQREPDEFIKKVVENKTDHPGLCKHGSMVGLCKHGC